MPVVIAAIAAIAALALLRGHLHLHRTHAAVPGDRFPALSVTTIDGSPTQLAPNTGVTVYNVFATWCPPCRAESPAFAEASRRLEARGVRVVGIDQGDPPASVRAFVAQYDLRYDVYIDDGHLTDALLGARVIPETIITRAGILEAVYVGPLDTSALDALVRSIG